MKKVVILTETEYEDLKNSEKSLENVLKNLNELIDSPKELREYIAELLDRE